MAFGAAPFGATPLGAAASSPARLVTALGPVALFGTPFAVFTQIKQATGAAPSTAFGLANVYPGYVPSLGLLTHFGTPTGPQVWRASSLGPVARIPTAYYAYAQTLTTTGCSTTVFGTPLGARTGASGGALCQAAGFAPVQFGTPAAAWRQTAATTGLSTTTFGTPTYLRGGARVASGFCRTRLGRPRAASRFDVRYASGSTSTAFGTPASGIRSRVSSLDIVSRFGTPLLTRSTTC